jgi:hypothetical protein
MIVLNYKEPWKAASQAKGEIYQWSLLDRWAQPRDRRRLA